MSINVWTDPMQHAELFGKPVLFTNWLILRDLVPKGWHCYDLQGTQNNPNGHAALVDRENIFHTGTILSPQPLKREGTVSRRVNGSFHLLGEEMTLEQFCEKHDLEYPQDTREFILRPASPDEALVPSGFASARRSAVAGMRKHEWDQLTRAGTL